MISECEKISEFNGKIKIKFNFESFKKGNIKMQSFKECLDDLKSKEFLSFTGLIVQVMVQPQVI